MRRKGAAGMVRTQGHQVLSYLAAKVAGAANHRYGLHGFHISTAFAYDAQWRVLEKRIRRGRILVESASSKEDAIPYQCVTRAVVAPAAMHYTVSKTTVAAGSG